MGDAHADWTSEFQHAVKHLDRDFDLTHATCIFTLTQCVPNQALVAADRRFDFRTPIVAFVAKIQKQLLSGSDASIEAMTERLGIAKGHLTSLVRLFLLSPDIVRALLKGRQSPII